MIYLTLCALAVPAWQDFRQKTVYHTTLLGLWAISLVILAANYVNGGCLGWGQILKALVAAVVSFAVNKYGTDRHIGRGDLLIIAWIFVMIPFSSYLKVLFIGFFMLWIWAIGCKLRKRKEELAMIPFLWIGCALSILF